MKLIHLDPEKCTQCGMCVPACPVQAIKHIGEDDLPVISEARCIGCGSCISACPVAAITYHQSIKDVWSLINTENKVVAIVDPSIAAEFPDITDYRKFAGMIRMLGFTKVTETAFAVELVAARFASLLESFKGRYYITSNCPTLVMYIEKYFPHLIDNLVPLASPMLTMAAVVRENFGSDTKVVAITPCVSQKIEAVRSQGAMSVDQVLTFTELRQMFAEKNITETSLEFSDFDPPHARIGSIYPIHHGFIQAAGLSEHIFDSKMVTASGKREFLNAVREFDRHPELINRHFNVFYDKGCLMGPGMTPSTDLYQRQVLVTDYALRRASAIDKREWQQNFARFSQIELGLSFAADDQRLPIPAEEIINEVLQATGKLEASNTHICEMCGFESCRDFAIAVAQGLVRTESCVAYSLKNKKEYIRTLRQRNDALDKSEKQLRENEKDMREALGRAQDTLETMGLLMKRLSAGMVMVDENLRIMESNPAFIDMLGEDVAMINEVIPGLKNADLKTMLPFNFYNLFKYVLNSGEDLIGRDIKLNNNLLNVSIYSILRNKVVGAVIRDMYLPEVQKEVLEKRLTEVIDQNLRMVQEIGFLLGEGASSTERMLNSLIETHKQQKNQTE